jgi:hypothetical protein
MEKHLQDGLIEQSLQFSIKGPIGCKAQVPVKYLFNAARITNFGAMVKQRLQVFLQFL